MFRFQSSPCFPREYFDPGMYFGTTLSPTIPVGGGGGGFELVAIKKIQSGDEITISYGDYNNERLLKQYGFTIPDNPIL